MDARMPTRPAVPAPKPLSPRAVRYITDAAQDAAERRAAVAKAFAAGEENARALAKASKVKSDQVACYSADGTLIGVCDPDAITMLTDATPANAADAPPTDLTPAPSAAVGTPADAVPAAKAMSAGVRGGHQLGGANPPGGVPVAPAEDAEEDAEVAKARVRVMVADLKKSLVDGGRSGTATEAAAISEAMNRHLITKFQEMQRQGRAPGAPRRP